jgi:hypothetical protein
MMGIGITRLLVTRLRWLLLAWLGILLIFSSSASAQTDIYKSLQYPFYDSGSGENCSATVDIDLSGNNNREKAFNFFVAKGLATHHSAGIVGNLMQESGVNPHSNQHGGGPGRGIAQWSVDGRWVNLNNWAKGKNLNPLGLETQLEFIWYEMNEVPPWNETLPEIKDATNVVDATIAFEEKYEKPGIPHRERRIRFARQILQQYGSGNVGDKVDIGPEQDCSGISGPGQDTKFIDGFTVYSQYDPDWANKPYSTSTIGASGCGPAAMAMIITALTGQQITPVATANYAAAQGQYVPGQGSRWSIARVLAARWGLKSQFIGAEAAKITATLQAGGLVIATGQGPKPFTSGGHFIVVRAVTASGKWRVGDSGHNDTSSKDWAPQQLLSSMNDGSVYAITK